ncbi:MAG: FAD-dependent oxidoreductase [Deltaproteobacteria bacterium]|nr:FAD-dependent oxidoreductase [Deltaproteobacteria bacterium]
MDTPELIIVGGGIAGSAAALRAAQNHLRTIWVLGDKETRRRSRAEYVYNVDNMIGVHPDLVLDQLDLPERPTLHIGTRAIIENVKKRLAPYADFVTLVEGEVTAARKRDEGFEVEVGSEWLGARNLILATGCMDRQPIIGKEKGGKIREMPHWVFPFANAETVLYCIRCEGHLTREARVGILGHSETAAQVALMVAERYGTCRYLFTNGQPCEAQGDTRKLLAHHGVEIVEAPIRDLEAGTEDGKTKKGFLAAVHVEASPENRRCPVDFLFVSLGIYRIYNDLAVQLGASLLNEDRPIEERHVRIDAKAETDVRGLFAVGDVALRPDEPVMKQIYTSQEYAVRAVDNIDRRRRSRLRQEILAGP